VRHLFGALELGTGKMYGHIKKRRRRGEFLEFCRYLRSLHPAEMRIAIVRDNFSPHLTTRKDKRAGDRAAASNVEIAYTPASASRMNRIGCQFTALREFTLNGTDHASHREQGSMIRRYIAWRNRNIGNPGCAGSSTGQTLPDAALVADGPAAELAAAAVAAAVAPGTAAIAALTAAVARLG
jgi:hypothetical protein